MIIGCDPNPQAVEFALGESPEFYVTMAPPQTILQPSGQPWGMTLFIRQWQPVPPAVALLPNAIQLNVIYSLASALAGNLFNVVDPANGVFVFGPILQATLVPLLDAVGGLGDYLWDVWRTDAGFERRLCWGTLHVTDEP
jgi:hypothetical protein